MNDLKFAFRQALKNPGFTFVAVMVLALGIGPNITLFSIINTVLVKPLKVPHPEQLVGIYQHERESADNFSLFSYPDFADLRSGKDVAFTDVFAFGLASLGLQGELTERLSATLVSANYFSALGVPAALGRGFLPEEENSGTPVTVLSHTLWKRLGSDPLILGKKLKLTRGDVTVVGVMPAGFNGALLLVPSALFLPIGMADFLDARAGQPLPHILSNRGDHRFMLMGRLKPGMTLANVPVALSALNQKFAMPDPAEPKTRTLICSPAARFSFGNYPDRAGKDLAPGASLAYGLSMLVLFIACLNLANMMLARGSARRKEIALRLALGAGRGRILSQLLTEGLLLGLLGGAAGLLGSMWAMNLLGPFVFSGAGLPADLPKFDFAPDWRVLVITLLVSTLATLFFALGPAWKLARLDLNSDLRRHATESTSELGKGRFGARNLLAVGQLAFALALLVAAALFSRSALNAAGANPGFEFGSNFYLTIDSTLSGYPESRVRELIREATDRLSALTGVESVSPALNLPFGESSWAGGVQRGGAPASSTSAASPAEGKELEAAFNVVGADYFRTLGLPLQRGREFERRESEVGHTPPVAIISQNLADQLWPNEDPLGRSIQLPSAAPGTPPALMTVVGVVPPVHLALFEQRLPAEVYFPLGQNFQANIKLIVRVAPGVNAASLMVAARDELRRLDPQIPLTEVKTLRSVHSEGMPIRMVQVGSVLFGAFGGLALLLSLLGVYGLKSYAIARRTREIGIRIALGASGSDVVAMILRETAWLAGLGLGLGLLLALVLGRLAAGFLYRVPAMDTLTFSIIPLLLLLVTLVACVIPARRAAKLDPVVALRYE